MNSHSEDSAASAPLLDTLSSARTTASGTAPPCGSARYERGRELGRGGMGRVVEALDKQFQRTVALKELAADGDAARFATEALITGNLEHPGIPSVYERGVDERGGAFYVMRKVRGRTLGALLAEAKTLEERLKLLPVVTRTAQTLGYAHEHRVIHRDVKPDNILVGLHGEVVLLDWGIARLRTLGADSSDSLGGQGGGTASSTLHGAVIGTPAYMSPEQALGRTDELDERTDVFALGALLFHLLTGRLPYEGVDVNAVLEKARRAEVPSVKALEPQAPQALAAICARAMARAQSERFPHANAMAKALEEFSSSAVLNQGRGWWVAAASSALTAAAVAVAASLLFIVIRNVPSFKSIGDVGYIVVATTCIGLTLSAFEWATRGRHALSSLSASLGAATLIAGLAATSLGLGTVFKHLRSLAANDPQGYRVAFTEGAWEALGGLTLALGLATVQTVLWAVARRRAELAATERQTGLRR